MKEALVYCLFAAIFTTGGGILAIFFEKAPRSRVCGALRYNCLSHITGISVVGTLSLLGLSVGPAVPDPIELAARMLAATLLADLWFFSVHFVMHKNRFLFRNIHYLHHLYTKPIALEALVVHPVEHGVLNIGAFAFGTYLASPGPLGTVILACLVAFSTLVSHSTALARLEFSRHHLDHHSFFNVNFASVQLTDIIFGTGLVPVRGGTCPEPTKKKQRIRPYRIRRNAENNL